MKNYLESMKKTRRVRMLLTAGLALGSALGTTAFAQALSITPPATSATIAPPAGNVAFVAGRAAGTQGYVCLPQGAGASWTVNGARPEATLYQNYFGRDVQIITHFLSPNAKPNQNAPDPLPFGNPTWQSSFDSSRVWAQAAHSVPAGSEDSCPNEGAIPCLLLEVVGAAQGPAGGRMLAGATYVQRLNTKGGAAPAEGCSTAQDVGKQALVPYSADYYFFHHGNQ